MMSGDVPFGRLSGSPPLAGRARAARRAPGSRVALLAVLALCVFAGGARSLPDDDDDDPDNPPKPQPVQGGWNEANLDQWIFNGVGAVGGARQRLDEMLTLHVDDIDRACQLTDAQKKKLQLVGRGDIKRFYLQYDKVKEKFQQVKNDQQKMQEIWPDINQLQAMLQFGLFEDNSLLARSLHATLNEDQNARFAAVQKERRAFNHRAVVELVILSSELSMPLRADQRRAFIDLMVTRLKPPRRSGVYGYMGYYYVMYQLSQLPEEQVKPLFDDVQWKAITRQFNQCKQMKPWLKQNGLLVEDEDDDSDSKPAAAAK
jgi:hypothetical protein